MRRTAILSLALAMMLTSCYDEDLSGIDLGYAYFPLELGRYVTYDVDSTWRDDIIGPVGAGQLSYVLRVENESTFIDEAGREAVRVERRRFVNGNWPMKDVWSRVTLAAYSEQNEENVVFLKHNFPIREGKVWDGHARATPLSIHEFYRRENIPTDWEFRYKNVDIPYTIGNLTFDSTVTVVQIDRPAVFGVSLYAEEVYAKHVGLIYRKLMVYNVQQAPDDPNGRDTIGYEFEMRAIDFGP